MEMSNKDTKHVAAADLGARATRWLAIGHTRRLRILIRQ
jgi:hypothetical protein